MQPQGKGASAPFLFALLSDQLSHPFVIQPLIHYEKYCTIHMLIIDPHSLKAIDMIKTILQLIAGAALIVGVVGFFWAFMVTIGGGPL